MTLKDIAHQFDELYVQLWKLDGLAMAINIAISEGGLSGNSYDGALAALTDMTYEVKEQSEKLQIEVFDLLREEKK